MNDRVGGDLLRRQVARGPGPAGEHGDAELAAAEGGALEVGVGGERRGEHQTAVAGGLDHDPDVPRERKLAGDSTLQVIPAERRFCPHGTGLSQFCANRRTACRATDSVAKSGGEPVRRSMTIRFNASTPAAWRRLH